MAEAILSEPVSQDKQTVVTVTFYGTELVTIRVGEGIFVSMRPIVEGLGLSWSRQRRKLQESSEKYGCGLMATPSGGGEQESIVIPLRKLNGWLFSVNPMKVKREIREKLIRYQEECFAALYSYWHNGIAVNPNAIQDAPTGPTRGTLTPAQQQELKELVQAKASAYPDAVKPKVFSQIWMRLQRKFKVPRYSELPMAVFGEARDYVIAMQVRSVDAPALEGTEAKALPTPQPRALQDYAWFYPALPDNSQVWRRLSFKAADAFERFGKEIDAIKDEAFRPFKENRRSGVATFLDDAMGPHYALFRIADEQMRTAYRCVYEAMDGLVATFAMLQKG